MASHGCCRAAGERNADIAVSANIARNGRSTVNPDAYVGRAEICRSLSRAASPEVFPMTALSAMTGDVGVPPPAARQRDLDLSSCCARFPDSW